MSPSKRPFLVVDLEATCDEGGALPRHETELIELGAVLVDDETLEPLEEFQTFVRPVRHPVLTPFCTQLTSITQAQVESAPRFPEAARKLRLWLGARSPLFSSWGDYDRAQLERDARRWGLAPPLGGGHFNVKQAFSEALGEQRRYGVDGALRRVGLRFEGSHHRGIDDARNIARLLPWALRRPEAHQGSRAPRVEPQRKGRERETEAQPQRFRGPPAK